MFESSPGELLELCIQGLIGIVRLIDQPEAFLRLYTIVIRMSPKQSEAYIHSQRFLGQPRDRLAGSIPVQLSTRCMVRLQRPPLREAGVKWLGG